MIVDRLLTDDGAAETWWDGLDREVLDCLIERGPMAPGEIGCVLGMSEDAAASILSLLAQEGRVRIRLVDLAR